MPAKELQTRAFTLIELLIVVAIIAILASIAVPNFLEAQIRAKVARAQSDMRTMATGLEQYRVDNNVLPDIFFRMNTLTTPIAYLSSVPQDPFQTQERRDSNRFWRRGFYRYGAMPILRPTRFALASYGPDTDVDTYLNSTADNADSTDWDSDNQALRLYPGYSSELFSETGKSVEGAIYRYITYDSTNGSVSNGDVFRFSDQ